MRNSYDLVVLGGGSGGLVAARFAAWLGASVLLVERSRLGGDCLYTGCIPSKALIRSAQVAHLMRHADDFGLEVTDPAVDITKVMASVNERIQAVGENDSQTLLESEGVDVVFGAARFVSNSEIRIGDLKVGFRRALIATGSHPTIPSIRGINDIEALTTDSVFALDRLPSRLFVAGGGPVAVELGQAFARLGSEVILAEKQSRLLPDADPDASAVVQRVLEREGVDVRTGAEIESFRRENSGLVVTLKGSDGLQEVNCTDVLLALGRSPNHDDLGLESAGVSVSPRSLDVDQYLRTNQEHIYACGDVTGPPFLTHVAGYEGAIAVRNALLPLKQVSSTRILPSVIFTDPEVAGVGLTEQEAAKSNLKHVVTKLPMKDIDRAQTERSTDGFIKTITTPNGELLGAHIVGPGASEAIQEFVAAMHSNTKLGAISPQLHPYPTLLTGNQLLSYRFSLDRWSFGRLGLKARQALVRVALKF